MFSLRTALLALSFPNLNISSHSVNCCLTLPWDGMPVRTKVRWKNINEILFALLLTESINQKGKREDFKTLQGLFKKIITVESKLLGKVW